MDLTCCLIKIYFKLKRLEVCQLYRLLRVINLILVLEYSRHRHRRVHWKFIKCTSNFYISNLRLIIIFDCLKTTFIKKLSLRVLLYFSFLNAYWTTTSVSKRRLAPLSPHWRKKLAQNSFHTWATYCRRSSMPSADINTKTFWYCMTLLVPLLTQSDIIWISPSTLTCWCRP